MTVNITEQNKESFRSFHAVKKDNKEDKESLITIRNHHHRGFTEIAAIIENSSLSENVKKLSINIFRTLGLAESKIHNQQLEEIHFHEVGAIDAIIDIVGAAICYEYLKPDKVIISPVELGGGMVNCAHGTFPVPAPATLEILTGKPIRTGAVQAETTTPTGAAILVNLGNEFTDKINLVIQKIGYGIGHRDNAIPNVLRVCMCTTEENVYKKKSSLLECNIDDMNPEYYGYLMDKIFDSGADDVFLENISMKKNRPAIKINVLCESTLSEKITHLLLLETSTLGVRCLSVEKTTLKRNQSILETPWGSVRIKHGYLDGSCIKSKPEYDDCLKISKEYNIPLIQVYNEIAFLINKKANDETN